MRTGLFIQVRLGSTRLPGKALLPLPGGTVIQHVMRAVTPVGADVNALLTDAKSLPVLRPLAESAGFEAIAGPDEDVLERYGMAVRAFRVDEVIRVTGDNPLTSARLARDILKVHRAAGADLSHYLGVPWGSGVEVVSAAALLEAGRDARRADEREHITTYLYRHSENYRIVEAPAPAYGGLASCRVTVDTAEDLETVRRIFAALYKGSPIEIDEVIAWWKDHVGTAAAGAAAPRREGPPYA
jgi:spore coat polysaccharide biosynthesis protein SpsF